MSKNFQFKMIFETNAEKCYNFNKQELTKIKVQNTEISTKTQHTFQKFSQNFNLISQTP